MFLLHFLVGPTPIHAQVDYPPFPASDLSFVGDGGINGDDLRLIRTLPPAGSVAAAVWHNETQRIADGFDTTFTFRIVNAGGVAGGGDGLVFVIHAGGTGAIGLGGRAIGYGGIEDSLAIEFDTYLNSELGDPNNNHLSIHPVGSIHENSSIASTSAIPNIRDGDTHTVRIEYDGPSNAHQMRVFVDNITTPVLTLTANLPTLVPGAEARLGFTAGAASAYENHDILSWSFASRLAVREVTFHQITPSSVPIDDNPLIDDDGGTDDGFRIFPDDDVPLDEVDRSTIRVEGDIGATLPNTMVYFRAFDMDDPSAHSEVDLDVFGNDNRGGVGGSGAGQLQIPPGASGCLPRANGVACPTNASGIASVNFKVTMQPGDNFAIAASTSENEIDAVNLDPTDGHHLLSGSGVRLDSTCDAADKVCRSRMLTVWRRLHIETDFMPTVEGNHLDVRLIPPPPGGPPGITIAPGETRVLDVYSPVYLYLEAGRFAAGRAVVGGGPISSMSVSDNTENKLTVTNTQVNEILILYSETFRLYDNDDFNNNDGTSVIGDNGEPVPLPNLSLIPEGTPGDDRFSNVLALAYIRPVYDLVGNGLSQQFKVNIADTSPQNLNLIISYDNVGTDGNEQFWTIYLLNAYQGWTLKDGDGNHIGSSGDTRVVLTAPPVPEDAEVGFTLDYDMSVSLVYVEPAGSKECNSRPSKHLYACDVSAVTAREVAKALGAQQNDGGLLDLDSTILSVESLRKIRDNTVP